MTLQTWGLVVAIIVIIVLEIRRTKKESSRSSSVGFSGTAQTYTG